MLNAIVFLTWYVNPPDPPYWKHFNLDGLLVSLSSIAGFRKLSSNVLKCYFSRGLKRLLQFKGTLLVDSLISPLREMNTNSSKYPQHLVLYLQYVLGADVLIHKDVPFVDISLTETQRKKMLKKTLVNAEAALEIGSKLGKDVILVVQGWDETTYRIVAQKYLELGAKYIGIGSLVRHRSNSSYLYRIIRAVREEVGNKVWVHSFGVSAPSIMKRILKFVNSFDTSTPIRAAANRELIYTDKGELKRVRISSIEGLNKLKEIAEESSDHVESEFALNVLKSSRVSELKYWLAVLNAYKLIIWVSRMKIEREKYV